MKKYLRLQTVGDDECLYHYTHGSSLMNILRTEKLYATKSSFLNDTNELDYITRVAADVIGEIERPEWRQILMRQIIDTMEEVKRHDTFVLSFSTDRDSITLWAEFGEETGYNVGFRGRELIRRIGNNQEIYCHGRVIYDTDGHSVYLIRVSYNITAAQKRIYAAHLPEFLAERLSVGR